MKNSKSGSQLLFVVGLSVLMLAGCNHPEVMGIDLVKGYSKSMSDDYFYKGSKAFNAHDYKKAYTAYAIACEYNPSDTEALTMAGASQFNLKNYGSAYEYATRAMQLDPEYGEAVYLAATSLALQKHFADATVYYKKLEDIAPSPKNRVYTTRVLVYYGLGMCSLNLGEYIDAKNYFEKGLELKKYKQARRDVVAKIEEDLKLTNRILAAKRW